MTPANVLITGASSGIGLELAHIFASHGDNLVLVAKDADKLEKISKTLSNQYGLRVGAISLDLTAKGSIKKLFDTLDRDKIRIDTVINNAGFGLFGLATETDWSEERNMIELNIMALTEISKHFAKQMSARKSGTIVNVASTASFYPGVMMSVYYATKAYVLSYTLALAEELAPQGVHVMALCPGPTRTGFATRAQASRSRLFGKPMSARKVAELAYSGLKKRRRIIVTGGRNKASVFISRLIPWGMAARLVRRVSSANS